ncbi:hypothetical protein [Synechococcus sp. BS56D]|uniref:hypothetical protein n=1 Tax=Synechococcus sp. BS56D TaxID=2055944 RepID=UPI001039225E|nr:hypothetical protein [Synechococcus sp. BS56D]
MGDAFGDFQEASVKTRSPHQGTHRGAVQEKMKSKKENRVPKHLVPNNPQADKQLTGGSDWDSKVIEREKKRTLYDGWYKTYKGHYKQNDEKGEPRKTEYLTIAPSALKKQKEWDARQRLKKKNAVPTRKDGSKVFEEFMAEANRVRPSSSTTRMAKEKIEDWENAYRAAQVLDQTTWIVLMKDLVTNLI